MKRLAPELDEVAVLIGTASARTEATAEELHAILDRISGFAGVIRGLAAQSKLLALNATIEAARIGDAGRGFAVVAGEMKSLADHAGCTAADIETCLGDALLVAADNRTAVAALHAAVDKGIVFARHFAELAVSTPVTASSAPDGKP